jgi:hypothetical protein
MPDRDIGTRAEHLAWAKQRALELLPERPDLAVSSLCSDLQKHSETAQRGYAVSLALTELLANGADAELIAKCIGEVE